MGGTQESKLCQLPQTQETATQIQGKGMKLKSQGVKIFTDKHGRTPLDLIPCIAEAFKKIKKGSGNYKRILLSQNLKGCTTYRGKTDKRFDISL